MKRKGSDKKSVDGAAKERKYVGTPAGELPEMGRRRHGTECLTDVCGPEEVERRRKTDEQHIDEDFTDVNDEFSPTGGITGTKVKGGVPAGGTIEPDDMSELEEEFGE